jgi:cobalt/nickel transport system permease protein
VVVHDAGHHTKIESQVNITIHTSKRINRSGFVERTLADINHTLEQSLFAERIALRPGLLQGLDPRLKIIAMIMLLLAISLSHQLWVIVLLYFLILSLAFFSKVTMEDMVKRVWLIIPFFTGIIALPALFIVPGPAWVHLPLGLVITTTGLNTALFLLLRVGTSVSVGVLLILTTPWNSVLKALGVLHLPAVIILMLGMTYRYIHLLLNITNDMFLSRKSRLLRPLTGAEGRKLIGATSGALLNKSLQVSSEVYLAMQSRGFRDYPRTIDTFEMHPIDWVAGFIVTLLALSAIWLGR